jgi:hypothetical protein
MSNPTIELAKKISAQLTQEEIKRGVADIRAKNPGMSFVEAYNQLATDRPDVLEEYAPAKDAKREQEISDEAHKLMKLNPGMMFSTATGLLAMTRPDLFPDSTGPAMEKEEKVREMQDAIHEEIKKMREREPHLTHALAFNRLMKEKPELFKFDGLEKGGEN